MTGGKMEEFQKSGTFNVQSITLLVTITETKSKHCLKAHTLSYKLLQSNTAYYKSTPSKKILKPVKSAKTNKFLLHLQLKMMT